VTAPPPDRTGPVHSAYRPHAGADSDAELRTGQEPGGPASSALHTILGEYVVPGATGAWQATLVQALAVLGFPAATVRQAISRAVRGGALATTRHGKRAYVEVRAEARETMLRAVAHRETALTDAAVDMDDEWDVVVVRFREKDTNRRYHLRTSLLLKGLGYLGNGVWISPPSRLQDDVVRTLAAEPGASVVALRSRIVYPEVLDVVRRAWDLDAAAARYEDLLTRFGALAATSPDERFVAWTGLIQAWRQCVQADPGLPAKALPDGWPRRRAAEVVASKRVQWRPDAHAYFSGLAA
jgi:phenylacetic acid degradation operon negative regulatory protein